MNGISLTNLERLIEIVEQQYSQEQELIAMIQRVLDDACELCGVCPVDKNTHAEWHRDTQNHLGSSIMSIYNKLVTRLDYIEGVQP